ncbi:hypothetical protein SO802_013806 [Lithocarpus litseifolius]|uniref:Uncharacterized protein n=1 Tax=Lithocarpus litseifolius TaxID=425828 RepID=A0AAW2DAB8_9ROSI
MEAIHFSSHQATCLQRPVMEYGPIVQPVGDPKLKSTSVPPHFRLSFSLLLIAQHPNPNMEERKNQSLLSSSFAKYVKEQYVANNGEIPGGPTVLHSAPSPMGNHEMSAGPRVHGDDQCVPPKKGPVPPSAPNPSTQGP